MTYRRLTLSIAGGLLAGCCGTALAAVSPWHCSEGPEGDWVCVPAEPDTASQATGAGTSPLQMPQQQSTTGESPPTAKSPAPPSTATAAGSSAPQ
ncbi:MAG: hypothetical protein P8180_00645, partial [Gammaproteobacteria bacterium]